MPSNFHFNRDIWVEAPTNRSLRRQTVKVRHERPQICPVKLLVLLRVNAYLTEARASNVLAFCQSYSFFGGSAGGSPASSITISSLWVVGGRGSSFVFFFGGVFTFGGDFCQIPPSLKQVHAHGTHLRSLLASQSAQPSITSLHTRTGTE